MRFSDYGICTVDFEMPTSRGWQA